MPSSGSKNDTSRKRAFPLLWRQLQEVLSQRFSSQKTEKRDRFLLLIFATIILTIAISPQQEAPSGHYRSGEIIASDVRAGRDYLLEDKKLTAEKQAEAVSKIPLVYEFNESVPDSINSRLRKGFTFLENTNGKRLENDRESVRKDFSDLIGVDVTPSELMAFSKIKSDTHFLHDIEHALQRLYRTPVVASSETFLSDQLSGIAIYRVDGTKLPDTLPSDHIDIEQVRKQLLGLKLVSVDSAVASASVKAVISRMLQPSLTVNRNKTDDMKASAKSAVSPVLIQIKRGEMIARDGDRISPEQEMKLTAIASESSWLGHVSAGAGLMGIILVLLYFPYRFALKNIRKFRPSNKDILLLLFLTVGHFLLLRTLFSITPSLSGAFPSIDTSDYLYLFPFAATAIMVRIFVNSEVALVYAAITAPLAGLLYGSLPVVFYSLIGSIIGAHGVRHCDSRSTIFTAGLKVSVVNMAIALSFQLFNQSLFAVQTVYILAFSFAGGIASSVLASGAIPLLENLFQYTTDIKLIELTNLNSPILRELMIKAPGTYHHSVVVGNLVEAAAEAINANPLLARVAAYYHDVGKISKAQYFIENQSGGENRHDKLSPSMSALILITHVKEGAELVKQHRLGHQISEIIRQSHGTGLIKYFYHKALEQALPGQEINEHDFRYHGPKPQTREAGLVLLADNVEAASRTLVDASPARIQGLVQKIINNIFIDGQLDECELTLKNLHQIAWSFNQILAGIYHQRIDYPQPAFKEKSSGGKKDVEHCDNEPSKAAEDSGEEAKGGSSEDLKRLGMYF